MEVKFKNTVYDALIFNYRALLKRKSNLLFFGCFILLFERGIFKEFKLNATTVLTAIIFLVLMFIIFYSVMALVITMTLLFSSSVRKNKGFLVQHRMVFDQRGYIEETSVNRTEGSWDGVYKIQKGRFHIYFYDSPSTAHLIPRRVFGSKTEYDEFYNTLVSLKQSTTISSCT